MVCNTNIVSVVSKPQAKRAAAIQGQDFMQRVATNPFSNVARMAAHQVGTPAPTVVMPPLDTPKWPLDKEWEKSWPAGEDWCNRKTGDMPQDKVEECGQAMGDEEHGWAAEEEAHRQAMGNKECSQATEEEVHRQAVDYKAHSQTVGKEMHRQAMGYEKCNCAMEETKETQTVDRQLEGQSEAKNLMEDLDQEQHANPFLGTIITFLHGDALPKDKGLAHQVQIKAKQCQLFNRLLYHHTWPQHGSASTHTLAQLAIPTS